MKLSFLAIFNQRQTQHGTCSTQVSCLAYPSTLKMEAKFSSEMSVDFQQTTRYHIPEDSILHNYRCENLKSEYQTYFTQIIFRDGFIISGNSVLTRVEIGSGQG
jgi:hypothetical protein